MTKLLKNWENSSTCDDCHRHLLQDVMMIVYISIIILMYIMYPTIAPFPFLWFYVNSFYANMAVHHLFKIFNPYSPPLMMQLAWRLQGWSWPREFYQTKKKTMREGQSNLYHFHGESVEEVLKRGEKGEEITNMVLNIILAAVFHFFILYCLLLDLFLFSAGSYIRDFQQRINEPRQDEQRTQEQGAQRTHEQDATMLKNG